MARAGLTPQRVAEAAAALVDEEGLQALSLTRLAARLGVRPPSLYNHVEGLEGVERMVAIRGVGQLAETCRTAAMGRSGTEGLQAIARAYRGFAVAHPGVYASTQVARPDDPEYESQAGRLLEPLLALLAGFGLTGEDLIHAARSLRSALHGFALLETQSGFGLDVGVDRSFNWLMGVMERGIAGAASTG